MLDKTDKILDIFMSLIFIISIIMMLISIILIIIMLFKDNRYNQIVEINEDENDNNDNDNEDIENNFNKNDPLISEDNYPISILDKNSSKKLSFRYSSNNNKYNSPSTGVYTYNEHKKRNIYGNEYIEIHSNENEEIEKNHSARLNTENKERKNSYKFDKFTEI